MSFAQMQVGDEAVSVANPVPVYTVSAPVGGGGGGASTPVANFDFYRHLGSDGLVYNIPAGALAIDVMNIGTTDLSIKSGSMATANNLTPIDQPGATVLQLRAPTGYVLEDVTITFADAAAGAEILTVRGAP